MTTGIEQGLDRVEANYATLTPVAFIERAALAHPRRTAVIHGRLQRDWDATYRRCLKMASALRKLGVGRGIRWRPCCPIFRKCWNCISRCP